MIRVGAFRYFMVVAPPPWWILAALGAAVVTGAATVLQSAREIDSALALVLLLQMFAAAGGFNGTAARGHFDPLLVSRIPRRTIAIANLASATAPGTVAWVAIVIVAALSGGGDRAFSLQRHIAFLLVSSAAWSLGIRLPRMAPGVLWCASLLAFVLAREALTNRLLLAQAVPAGLSDVLAVAAACLICPFLLLSDFPAPRTPPVLFLLMAAATVAVWAGVRSIRRRDFVVVEAA